MPNVNQINFDIAFKDGIYTISEIVEDTDPVFIRNIVIPKNVTTVQIENKDLFKRGSKIQIDPMLDRKKEYDGYSISRYMQIYAGETVTVSHIYSDSVFKIYEDSGRWDWTKSMVKEVVIYE